MKDFWLGAIQALCFDYAELLHFPKANPFCFNNIGTTPLSALHGALVPESD